MSAPPLVGIFVGGQGSRMGGVAKGLLTAPGSDASLVQRLAIEIASALPHAERVLVGAAEAYAALGWRTVADSPPGIGPLGGLLGFLEHARARGASHVLCLACDLPKLSRTTVARLAHEAPEMSALVVEQAGIRNPLIARYAVENTELAAKRALAAGKRSLQAVLDELGARVATIGVSIAEAMELDDWDTLSDVQRGGGAKP
jgi:molybdopterin-guanine dinucleotide biosynthesis protein A